VRGILSSVEAGWSISRERFDPDSAPASVFAVGNGYLGLRGRPVHRPLPFELPEAA
jgi:hypothetical protein